MIYSYEQFVAIIEWINEVNYWAKQEEKELYNKKYKSTLFS